MMPYFCAMLFFLTFEILPHIASLANEDKLFRRLHNNLALIRLFNNVYDIFYFGLLDIGICIIYLVSYIQYLFLYQLKK
jgi:hypothetical protein